MPLCHRVASCCCLPAASAIAAPLEPRRIVAAITFAAALRPLPACPILSARPKPLGALVVRRASPRLPFPLAAAALRRRSSLTLLPRLPHRRCHARRLPRCAPLCTAARLYRRCSLLSAAPATRIMRRSCTEFARCQSHACCFRARARFVAAIAAADRRRVTARSSLLRRRCAPRRARPHPTPPRQHCRSALPLSRSTRRAAAAIKHRHLLRLINPRRLLLPTPLTTSSFPLFSARQATSSSAAASRRRAS